jgi:hypothetical protein
MFPWKRALKSWNVVGAWLVCMKNQHEKVGNKEKNWLASQFHLSDSRES